MQPKNLAFGGGVSATTIHPAVFFSMLIAIMLILSLPRKKVIFPLLISFFSIPWTQVLMIGPLHFPVLRVLLIAAMVKRSMPGRGSKGSKFGAGFNRIDRVVIYWAISSFVVVSLQWMDPQGMIKFTGDFLDTIFGYLAIRYFVYDRETAQRAVKALALICIIQGVLMLGEQFTHRNFYDFLGGNDPAFRDGHWRSEGALGTLFGGTFAGVSIPVFVWLWTEKRCKLWALTGWVGATVMVFVSHASTSWTAYGSGVLGLCFWPLRRKMRMIRFGLAGVLISLHLVMKGPVWSLIEKVDITGGSSSYHRYELVDNCIRHFSDWWLLGYRYYGAWGFDMWDLCNQFVVCALTGGLATLVLFIMIYSRALGSIGTARKKMAGDRLREWWLWCLGSVLFANIVASFGINYMIQLQVMLFVYLGCAAIATSRPKRAVVRIGEAGDGLVTMFRPSLAEAGVSAGYRRLSAGTQRDPSMGVDALSVFTISKLREGSHGRNQRAN